MLVLGTNIAVLLDCSKSSRQCRAFLTYLLTTDQVIRENPASRGTETSAEVLVGPPLGAGGWSETPVNSSGTREQVSK